MRVLDEQEAAQRRQQAMHEHGEEREHRQAFGNVGQAVADNGRRQPPGGLNAGCGLPEAHACLPARYYAAPCDLSEP